MTTETMERELHRETTSLQDSMALKEKVNVLVLMQHCHLHGGCRCIDINFPLTFLNSDPGRAAKDTSTEKVGCLLINS